MLLYVIYIFIFKYLIFSLNTPSIYLVITNTFENSNNKVFIMAIILGIFFKILFTSYKKRNLKLNLKLILIIFIDIIKTILFSYNMFLILTSIIFILLNEILKRKNIKINKYISFIFYIFTPLSVLYLIEKEEEKNIFILPSLIITIYKLNPSYLISMSIKSALGFIVLFLLSFNIMNNNKKRNIKMIFLIFTICLYYSSIF